MHMIAGLALRIPIFMGNTWEIKYYWLKQKTWGLGQVIGDVWDMDAFHE